MSAYSGPNVSISGLALCLDASNIKSYPGSGSTWFDLSGNNRHASLISSPTFTSGAIKYFTLNGVDQYATVANYSGINFNTCTIIYVGYLDSAPNSRNTIFSQYYGGNGPQFEWQSSGFLRSGFRQNSAATPEHNAPNADGQINAATLYHIAVTYNTGGVLSHYKNGVLLGTATNSTQTDINGGGNIDIGRNSSAGLYFKGRVYSCAVYNRVLNSREIIQDFISIRGRYGL